MKENPEVFKMCVSKTKYQKMLSLYSHRYQGQFKLGKKSIPEIGYFYAFDTMENALDWFSSDSKTILLEMLKGNFNLYLVKGFTTRIISPFHSSVRNLSPEDLRDEKKLKEFWSFNHTRLSRDLKLFPVAKGTVLIKDFTPVKICQDIWSQG